MSIFTDFMASPEFTALAKNSKARYAGACRYYASMERLTIPQMQREILSRRIRNSSKNWYLAVLKRITTWAKETGNDPGTSLRIKKLPSIPVQYHYTKEEIETLWSAVQVPGYEPYKTAILYLRLCFYTGCRPSEILNLKWDDVDLEIGFISIRGGKRQDPTAISRKLVVLPQIRECLSMIPKGKYPTVFNDSYGRSGISSYTIRKYLIEFCTKIDRKDLIKPLRSTRSGLATTMKLHGYDIYSIQAQLGHSNISTTMRYVRPTIEEKALLFKGI